MSTVDSSVYVTPSQFLLFLEKVFGKGSLTRDEMNFTVNCPRCYKRKNVQKEKFAIQTETLYYHCWSCKLKGRDLSWVVKRYYPGFYTSFLQMVERYKKTNKKLMGIGEQPPDSLVELPPGFISFVDMIREGRQSEIRMYLRYLQNRGVQYKHLSYNQLGCTFQKRFNHDYKKWEDFTNRVIFPSYDSEGELNFFTSRSILSSEVMKQKYMSCDEDKNSIIFNELRIDWNKPLIVVEGPFDLLKCFNLNVTCLLGKEFHEETYLFTKVVGSKTPVILCLDNEVEAQKDQDKIAGLLYSYGIPVYVLDKENLNETMKDKKDFGDVSSEEEIERIINVCSVPWNPKTGILNRISGLKTKSKKNFSYGNGQHFSSLMIR